MPESRVCRRCGEDKPMSEYHKLGISPNTGNRRWRMECSDCWRKFGLPEQKARRKKKKLPEPPPIELTGSAAHAAMIWSPQNESVTGPHTRWPGSQFQAG